MQLEPVDHNLNLFKAQHCYSQDVINQILTTAWLELPWSPQPGQEHWPRRRILLKDIVWRHQWLYESTLLMIQLGERLQRQMQPYCLEDSVFWVDMPGFTVDCHTDGMLPGAMQVAWHGHSSHGTVWRHDRGGAVRWQPDFVCNHGYVMVKTTDEFHESGLWHEMSVPVAQNEFRVTSYTFLNFV